LARVRRGAPAARSLPGLRAGLESAGAGARDLGDGLRYAHLSPEHLRGEVAKIAARRAVQERVAGPGGSGGRGCRESNGNRWSLGREVEPATLL